MTGRLPRAIHPGAWWIWALGLAVAAGATTNPLLLGLIAAVAGLVVAARHSAAPWSVGFRWYLAVAALVLVLRIVFRILTAADGPTVLFTLPRIELPAAAAGISLLGPVSAEALLAAAYDGLRLAVLIICVGAANSLANPKRLLAAVPPALNEIGTVLVVSVSVFPQLVESVGRVRRAQRLRSVGRARAHRLRRIVVPVLTDALDRSLALAASMDSRGYGRTAGDTPGRRRLTSILLLLGILGIAVGAYGVLDPTAASWLGAPMAIGGVLVGFLGVRAAGSRVRRTRYRAERWGMAEWLITASGIVAAAGVLATDVVSRYPPANPLSWPAPALLPTVAVLVAMMPVPATPTPVAVTG